MYRVVLNCGEAFNDPTLVGAVNKAIGHIRKYPTYSVPDTIIRIEKQVTVMEPRTHWEELEVTPMGMTTNETEPF